MDARLLLRLQAKKAHEELLDSIEGVSQEKAWAQAKIQPDEYLHSEGSILSVVLHVAGCKFMYASAAYRNLEIRWRDIIADVEELWPDWGKAKAYLAKAQDYWLASWDHETDFERMVDVFQGREMPIWEVIWRNTDHDGYHAGQIQVFRATLPPTNTPPPPEGDLWRKYCEPLPSY